MRRKRRRRIIHEDEISASVVGLSIYCSGQCHSFPVDQDIQKRNVYDNSFTSVTINSPK
jgi:hypothetical protein